MAVEAHPPARTHISALLEEACIGHVEGPVRHSGSGIVACDLASAATRESALACLRETAVGSMVTIDPATRTIRTSRGGVYASSGPRDASGPVFAVVSGLPGPGGPGFFMAAGFGGVASEGAALFLFRCWRFLEAYGGSGPFCAILRFVSSADVPSRYVAVECLTPSSPPLPVP
jgi:hypothetical protein